MEIPKVLQEALAEKPQLQAAFTAFTPFKQKEFPGYITEAKLEKTKLSRFGKILPMIEKGLGLNDAYP